MPNRARVTVTTNRQRILTDQQRRARVRGNQIGRAVVRVGKQECPVDEGTLRSSISHVVEVGTTSVKVIVGSPLPYAQFVHEGTGIYGPTGTPIRPTRAKNLKFRAGKGPKSKRQWVTVPQVKGQKPNPFLVRALTAVMGALAQRRG